MEHPYDESDDYVVLEHLSNGDTFYRQQHARGRVCWKNMYQRHERLKKLFRKVFGRKVAASFGGVYWGVGHRTKAHVHVNDRKMYFNARAQRTWGDLFMDVCHEWAHVETGIDDHTEDFAYHVERVASLYATKFLQAFIK